MDGDGARRTRSGISQQSSAAAPATSSARAADGCWGCSRGSMCVRRRQAPHPPPLHPPPAAGRLAHPMTRKRACSLPPRGQRPQQLRLLPALLPLLLLAAAAAPAAANIIGFAGGVFCWDSANDPASGAIKLVGVPCTSTATRWVDGPSLAAGTPPADRAAAGPARQGGAEAASWPPGGGRPVPGAAVGSCAGGGSRAEHMGRRCSVACGSWMRFRATRQSASQARSTPVRRPVCNGACSQRHRHAAAQRARGCRPDSVAGSDALGPHPPAFLHRFVMQRAVDYMLVMETSSQLCLTAIAGNFKQASAAGPAPPAPPRRRRPGAQAARMLLGPEPAGAPAAGPAAAVRPRQHGAEVCGGQQQRHLRLCGVRPLPADAGQQLPG
jgi:hypothetical protein